MANTLALSDLKPGQEYFLDDVRVTVQRDYTRLVYRFSSICQIGCDNPAFAQVTIRPVPREFKKDDPVIDPSGNSANVRDVDGEEAWLAYKNGSHLTWHLSDLRHADANIPGAFGL